MEYTRFFISKNDAKSNKPKGIFQALFDLCDQGMMEDYQLQWFDDVMRWFNKELKRPTQFSRSKRPHAASSGICWYKSSANEHINKMYELKEILNQHGIEVEIVRTNKPGYIVFEDDYQIVAEPFVETKFKS